MNLFKGLLGAGVGFLTGGPVGAAVGGLGGLDDSAQKAQSRALDQQKQIAGQQQTLFDTARLPYADLLGALRAHAGFGVQQTGTPNPYDNVTTMQQGIYANPADRMRLMQAEDAANQHLRQQQDALHFAMAQRGLTGSSIEASAHTALLADAARNKDMFARQLAMNAPGEYERRLGLLSSALNPGLGAGPSAAGMYGQQQALYGGQAAGQAAAAGNTISNYQMLQALKQARGGGYTPQQRQSDEVHTLYPDIYLPN